MNRIDRLTAILIMLQSKALVTADEIASRFEISTRTVYRDMRALCEAGVPIGAEAGVGYYLVEGYHLPPITFTTEEASSFLIAEKLVESFSDHQVKKHFKLATDKIKSVLPAEHQQLLTQSGSQVEVFHSMNSLINTPEKSFISSIQKGISQHKCLAIEYLSKSKQENLRRLVEPIGLVFYGFQWHLIAFCRLRNDFRDFRLDRIQTLSIDDDCVSAHADISIGDYFKSAWINEEMETVLIRFSKQGYANIATSKFYYGYFQEEESDQDILAYFAVNDMEYIAKWILSLGAEVVQIQSEKLSQLVRKLIDNLNEVYK